MRLYMYFPGPGFLRSELVLDSSDLMFWLSCFREYDCSFILSNRCY